MSGHWEAEQYKEQLEASRTAHAACEAARREALAEITRLRAELTGAIGACHDATEQFLVELDRAEEAEARLAAVIAVCDDPPTPSRMLIPYIRAAATGDKEHD